MTDYYAGVGSRVTPEGVCSLMTTIASDLRERGYRLRSGGADRADQAFAEGAGRLARDVYVPWRGFNDLPAAECIVAPELPNWPQALEIAERAHPKWENCSSGARKLLARNVYQILGGDLRTPVKFVIGWTRNASGSGGTGQAYRIARLLDDPPPIYDLGDEETLARFLKGWRPA